MWDGWVSVDGWCVFDLECFIDLVCEVIVLDGVSVWVVLFVYIVLNKLCGIVVSVVDECGCDMVYYLIKDVGLFWLGLVG